LIVAVIGAGNVGSGLATRLAGAGHDVRLANSRGPETLSDVAALTGAEPQHAAAAIKDAAVVALAVPYHAISDLAAAGTPWSEKVVIDATNFFEARDGAELRPGADGSSAQVQRMLVGSRVVKAFNTIPARFLAQPESASREVIAVPIAADDEQAARSVESLVTEMGFAPLRVGPLDEVAELLDVGGALFGKPLSLAEARSLLAHASGERRVGAERQGESATRVANQSRLTKEQMMIGSENEIARQVYEGFQRVELDRWDAVIAEDVEINSPAGYGMSGLQLLKDWAQAFARFAKQIDLVDEHQAVDEEGNGRAFITFNLHWKHDEDFMGLAPTGREGTSVETMLLTIRDHKITRIDVADNTVELPLYLWSRGWPNPHGIRPEPIVSGIDRRDS
jgi:predicted dinucleotide-binding enzyme